MTLVDFVLNLGPTLNNVLWYNLSRLNFLRKDGVGVWIPASGHYEMIDVSFMNAVRVIAGSEKLLDGLNL